MHGQGVFRWTDGRCYEGEYQNDRKHGKGVFISANGKRKEGINLTQTDTSVTITIKGVFGTLNNGGAFKIFGVKCTNIEKEPVNPVENKLAKVTGVKQPSTVPSLFKNEDKEMLKLRCMDSVSNQKKFDVKIF